MEAFKTALQAAIDAAPDQQTKSDLMRMYFVVTGEHPRAA